MKFTDGYWRLRDGVQAHYPAEAYDIEVEDGAVEIIAPTCRIRHRGDTLNTPVLTLRCTAVADGVVRVEVTHHVGSVRGPDLPVETVPKPPATVEVDDRSVVLTSGTLQARVQLGGPWALEFLADGKVLTATRHRALALIERDDGRRFLREQLDLGVGDHVYGLGERFGPFVKNGQVVDTWNDDGGTSSQIAYKSVPFYVTDAGYGVFVDDPGPVSFEVASEVNSRVQFSVEEPRLTYYVIHGPTPARIIERYTALTGRPALPPLWSFGLWLSTSFTTEYDEATITAFLEGMEQRDLPLSVFHFDCFWMREFSWTDLVWDERTFPDPVAMLQRLQQRGLRVCVWINPYIAQRSALFDEARAAGYLLRRATGEVWQWDQWQAGMGVIDLTNPAARDWFADGLEKLLAMGVDSFKTDFGERIPTDVVYHDGSDPVRMHNLYSFAYNRLVFELLEKHRGPGEAVVFARSATAGGQRFPVHWGGDSESTFESMAETLRGGLSLGLAGFGFWSHDIGGFEGCPDPSVFKRWIAFGLLSSHSRLHGSGSVRVPWAFDEESVDVLRHFTKLKLRLMPYLWSAAREAHESGVPMMRPMVLEFPDDPACSYLDRQYLLGPDLLVAPVFSAEGCVRYYVPAGNWTQLLTGEVIQGPVWREERHGFDSLPVLVRGGAVLPIGAHDDRPDYDHRDAVLLRVYEPAAVTEQRVVVAGPEQGADTVFRFVGSGAGLTVSADGVERPWRIQLVGRERARRSDDGALVSAPEGVVATMAADATRVELAW